MKSYLHDFFETFDYPKEARTVFLDAYDLICGSEFETLLHRYEEDMNCDFNNLLSSMTELCAKAHIHQYTGHLLLSVCLSKQLKKYYKAAGIDEHIWFLSVCDLKWKMMECKCVYDIWGSFVADWFGGFYNLSRFAIGKLQFELIPFQKNYEKNGLRLTPESMVINVHIPRTGTKLDRESQLQSYSDAAAFFKDRFQLEQIVFVCHSWLLFPRNKEVLSPASNLYSFISDYEIIEQGEYQDYSWVWRLFDKNYTGNVDELPQDTSFRRAYADWIKKGEKTGWGHGVFSFK